MKSDGIIPIILQPETGDPAISLSQFRHRCIFLFNPFLKTANPQLADVNFFHRQWFQNQLHLINIAAFQNGDGPDANDVIFIYTIEIAGIKHFVDIP